MRLLCTLFSSSADLLRSPSLLFTVVALPSGSFSRSVVLSVSRLCSLHFVFSFLMVGFFLFIPAFDSLLLLPTSFLISLAMMNSYAA
mmetsp:Transcript_3000/g.5868  ORF Transcript_3000/g.5868 Transcript_3000/m.5868 type:complete len:87 (-) Transcript_3000:85-345(-)